MVPAASSADSLVIGQRIGIYRVDASSVLVEWARCSARTTPGWTATSYSWTTRPRLPAGILIENTWRGVHVILMVG